MYGCCIAVNVWLKINYWQVKSSDSCACLYPATRDFCTEGSYHSYVCCAILSAYSHLVEQYRTKGSYGPPTCAIPDTTLHYTLHYTNSLLLAFQSRAAEACTRTQVGWPPTGKHTGQNTYVHTYTINDTMHFIPSHP